MSQEKEKQKTEPTGAAYPFFAFINRLKLIKRWNLMRNLSAEDVAQHSHMTAVIAHTLGLVDREILKRPTNPDRCAVLALYHETAEVLTGDMPTPVKYRNPAMAAAYKDAEREAELRLLNGLPDALKGELRDAVRPDAGREATLVKFADKIAAYIKCVEEVSAGNAEFSAAKRTTEDALRDTNDPAVRYFMQHFAASFSMNLDELMQSE
jgi:5'-deoxynucleotidase